MEWFENKIKEEWEERTSCHCCPCCGCSCDEYSYDSSDFEEFRKERYKELEEKTMRDFEKEVLQSKGED